MSPPVKSTLKTSCSGRRGQSQWIQPFMILVFVFLLIISLIILTTQRKQLQVTRPELDKDLRDQRANTFLISTLRTQATAAPIQLAGMNIADIVIIDEYGNYDAALRQSLRDLTPESLYQLTITYQSGRSLQLQNVVFKDQTLAIDGARGSGQAMLPANEGNVIIKLELYDRDLLDNANVAYTQQSLVLVASATPQLTGADQLDKEKDNLHKATCVGSGYGATC